MDPQMTPISQMGRADQDPTTFNLRHLRNLRIFPPHPLRFKPLRSTAEVAEERRGDNPDTPARLVCNQ